MGFMRLPLDCRRSANTQDVERTSFRAGALGDNPTYLAGRERTYEGMRMAAVPEG